MKLILFTILCLMCTWATAGSWLDKVVAQISGVSTTVTKSEASSTKIDYGYIERVDVKFSVSTNTVSVTMLVSNELNGTSTTILENTIRATNFSYYPRIAYHNTSANAMATNEPDARIVAWKDIVYLIATNASPANVADAQTVTATVIYERP